MSSTIGKMINVPKELVGATGRRYCFKELLQHKPQLGSVWVATYEQENFVLKDIPKNIASNFTERIWPQLQQTPSALLRVPIDTIPGRRTFVYQYMLHDFLHLVREKIPMHARRQILKSTLQAIADLHDRDVVHFDVKPDNVMVNCTRDEKMTSVEQVMLIDLENAAHLPGKRCVKGMLAGNDNWRSAEAHFKGELNIGDSAYTRDSIASFARLVSYFGDEEGLAGLMRHVGDEDINREILSMLWEERNEFGYKSFWDWPEAQEDEVFSDLVRGLMNLDPTKRITAVQALSHPWFTRQGSPQSDPTNNSHALQGPAITFRPLSSLPLAAIVALLGSLKPVVRLLIVRRECPQNRARFLLDMLS
ncbi:hypothetical protein BST61_g9442 [Cercospora zeina]